MIHWLCAVPAQDSWPLPVCCQSRRASSSALTYYRQDIKQIHGCCDLIDKCPQVQTAKGAVKRLKTLRHPNILTFLDDVEVSSWVYFGCDFVILQVCVWIRFCIHVCVPSSCQSFVSSFGDKAAHHIFCMYSSTRPVRDKLAFIYLYIYACYIHVYSAFIQRLEKLCLHVLV